MEKTVARVALFAALIAALGLVPQIMLPFAGGVPITAQTLGVMLAGLVLGPWRGTLAVLLLIVVVALGAPVLAGGRGGLGVFVGPTVGFLLGWAAATLVIGWAYRVMASRGVFLAGLLASVLGGIVVLYVCGIIGLSLVTQMPLIQAAGVVLIFIPGDIIKAVLAALLNREIRRARPGFAE